MVIVMQTRATDEQLVALLERIESLGFRAHVSKGTERMIVEVIGDERSLDPDAFEALAGVERAIRILQPFRLASRDFHPETG